MEEGVDGQRSRLAWSGTYEDVKALAADLEGHFAPLRSAERERERGASSWRGAEAAEQEVVDRLWRVEAELRWQDRNPDVLIATGSVDEILDKARLLDVPPETLTLTVQGQRYGRALARVTLDRRVGSRIDIVRPAALRAIGT